MPWGRLDDSLYDHPKLDALGDRRLEGVGLLAVAVSWSNRRLTDGFIPAGRVALLGGTIEIADALVAAGLFDEAEGGYAIHDFLDYNDAKVDVLSRRAANALRQREYRSKSRGQSPSQSPGDMPVSHAGSNDSPSRPSPVPSRPVPSGPSLHEQRTQEAMRRRREEWEQQTGKAWPDAI